MGKLDEAKKIAERKAAEKQNAKKDKTKGNRLVNFFRELKAELKRIIWPDKKKLKQSTAIVLAIVLAAAVLIFVVDNIVNTSLTVAGFYDTTPRATTAALVEETDASETVAADTTATDTTVADTTEAETKDTNE